MVLEPQQHGRPWWEPARPTDLVVHDGPQAHNAHVDVILLADDAGVPQGLPAVGRGQPGWGVEEAAGVRAPNPASQSPHHHSEGLWDKRWAHLPNQRGWLRAGRHPQSRGLGLACREGCEQGIGKAKTLNSSMAFRLCCGHGEPVRKDSQRLGTAAETPSTRWRFRFWPHGLIFHLGSGTLNSDCPASNPSSPLTGQVAESPCASVSSFLKQE